MNSFHFYYRSNIFAKNFEIVQAYNAKHAAGEVTFTLALNNLSNLVSEFCRRTRSKISKEHQKSIA